MAEIQLDEEENEDSERQKAFLLGKRFNVVLLCNITSYFVPIDSSAVHGNIEEISLELDVHKKEFSNVTSRCASFRAFLEFLATQAAHFEELWKLYTKPGGLVSE